MAMGAQTVGANIWLQRNHNKEQVEGEEAAIQQHNNENDFINIVPNSDDNIISNCKEDDISE